MLQPRTARTLFVLINPSRSLERFTYLCAKEIQCSRQSSTASLPLKNNKQPYDPDDFVRKKFNTGAKKLSQLPKQIDYWEVTIPPTRKGSPDLPPLWKAPQQHYEYFSLKWGLRGMNKTAIDEFNLTFPRHHLDMDDLVDLGPALYKELNEAFAAGNTPESIETIERICNPSYAQSLIAAILEREVQTPNATYRWQYKRKSKPKIISFYSRALIEGQPESTLVQVIIRLHGIETLHSSEHPPKVEESWVHLALHYRMWERPGEWRIVGRVPETPLDRASLVMERRRKQVREQRALRDQRRPDTAWRRAWSTVKSTLGLAPKTPSSS